MGNPDQIERPKRGGRRRATEEPLTEEQRALVRDNLGLVAVHIRRFVKNLRGPYRDRERDDLFQEGCLGLARAAADYRPQRGIPFIAYALPRIRHAVSSALHSAFSTVRIPPKRIRPRTTAPTDDKVETTTAPKVYSLSDERTPRLAARESRSPGGPSNETIGQRLRDKYEQAVRAAQDELAGHITVRGDLDQLVRLITEERLLVPLEEARRSSRRIARETHSSISRVTDTEKRLTTMIRHTLDADPQLRELQRLARGDPMGTDIPIDADVECALRSAEADELMRRYQNADPTDRARLLHEVLEQSRIDIEGIFQARVSRLSNEVRQKLLRDTADLLTRVVRPGLLDGPVTRDRHRPTRRESSLAVEVEIGRHSRKRPGPDAMDPGQVGGLAESRRG